MSGNWSNFGDEGKIAYNFDFEMQFGLLELLRNYYHVLVKKFFYSMLLMARKAFKTDSWLNIVHEQNTLTL